jgi:hypothetical protein
MHYYTEDLYVYPQVETWDMPLGRRANNLSMPHPSNESKKLKILDSLPQVSGVEVSHFNNQIDNLSYKDDCFNDYYIQDTKIYFEK